MGGWWGSGRFAEGDGTSSGRSKARTGGAQAWQPVEWDGGYEAPTLRVLIHYGF